MGETTESPTMHAMFQLMYHDHRCPTHQVDVAENNCVILYSVLQD